MRTPNINYIIYFYMFICLTLLFFNIAYIFYMKIRQFIQDGRSRRWETELERIWNEEEAPAQAASAQETQKDKSADRIQ